MKKISVIIPCYNEKLTIGRVIENVQKADIAGLEKEIIVVDDGSDDGTAAILAAVPSVTVITHRKNLGKGAAVISALRKASGDMVVIQDADLEYDPADLAELVRPILNGDADAVFGSRFIGEKPRRVLNFHHYLANRAITFCSNLFTNLNLSDVEVGYKLFTREAAQAIKDKLTSKRFGIEIELAARLARQKFRIYEIGISYHGRNYDQGKKINWRDGLAAFGHIVRFNIFDRR